MTASPSIGAGLVPASKDELGDLGRTKNRMGTKLVPVPAPTCITPAVDMLAAEDDADPVVPEQLRLLQVSKLSGP